MNCVDADTMLSLAQSLGPDAQERLRISKLCTALSTPMVRYCRDLVGKQFTHVSGRFFFMFCRTLKLVLLAGVALGAISCAKFPATGGGTDQTRLLFSMTMASIMASTGPFVLRKFGADPATATGPMITTITDLFGNLLYFTLATYLLVN